MKTIKKNENHATSLRGDFRLKDINAWVLKNKHKCTDVKRRESTVSVSECWAPWG